MTNKVSFSDKGFNFKNIPVKGNPEDGYFYFAMGGVSSIVRQFMKQKFPGVKFQISTDSFSGGDSVGVYLNPMNVTKEQYKEISGELQARFEYGKFNSMEDIYEYSQDAPNFEFIGRKINTKYMQVRHYPKYGSKDYEEYQVWSDSISEEDTYMIEGYVETYGE